MRTSILIAALGLLPVPAFAQGWVIPRCGMVEPRGDMDVRPVRPMPIRDCGAQVVRTRSDVRAELVGEGASRVIRYEVEERFVNNGGRVGEADYLFPLPKGAAFQDLKLSINGELVAGETMGAGEARRIYEEIVRKQRDPALVEWMGHGLLRARIFPIQPGEEKRVVVRFQAIAEREGDAVRVDYFRGRAAPGGIVQQGDVARRPADGRTTFVLTYPRRADLGTAYSPTHSIDVGDDGDRRRVEVRGDASDLTLLVPVRAPASAAISVLAHAPGNEDAFALVALSPPAAATREAPMPRDVTLVLDVSGSMSGRKMEQARAAARQLLRSLGARDRFRLIDFSTDVRTFRDDFTAATSENLRSAERYIDALEAQGSTNISAALREALGRQGDADARDRLPVVLFVTDGEPTVGERDPARIADDAARLRGAARVFSFGVGAEVNVALLEQLAMQGRGTAQFVRPEESVERALGIVASRLVDPVLTDVRVRVEGNDDVRLSRVLPQQPVDLFAGQDLVLLARYSGHGRARVVFEGRRRGEIVRWASMQEFPERERDNPFVARLWATQRVGLLSAERRKNGANRELDDELRSLGERYGIPTELTSYLVLEPGMVADGRRRDQAQLQQMVVTGAPAAAPRERAFEAAKSASAQRAATSVAVMDSAAAANLSKAGVGGGAVTRVGPRTFVLRDGVWTDAALDRTESGRALKRVRIKAFSAAYFDVVAALPELREAFALGDRVVVRGRGVVVESAVDGAEQLSAAEIRGLTESW